MPTRTTPSITIPAGTTRIQATVTFPSKDGTVTVAYMVQKSLDNGSTWRDEAGATIRGDADPIANKQNPGVPFSLSFSHNGVACLMRAVIDTSKTHATDFSVVLS